MNPAEAHLCKVSKPFAKVTPGHEPFPTKFPKKRDPYQALVRSVVFQQLSGKAANTIHTRMLALFPDCEHPAPEQLKPSPNCCAAPGFRARRSQRSKMWRPSGSMAQSPKRARWRS